MSHLKAMFSEIFSHITMVTTPSPSLSLGSLDGSSERRERREGERERREGEREREGGREGEEGGREGDEGRERRERGH